MKLFIIFRIFERFKLTKYSISILIFQKRVLIQIELQHV